MSRFLVISDPHLLPTKDSEFMGWNTYECFSKIIKHAMKDGSFDGIILTGDISQEGDPESYQIVLDELRPFKLPLIVLPGNHDLPHNVYAAFGSERLFEFENNWQMICLNSWYDGRIAGKLSYEELQLLSDSLSKKADSNFLVAIHHPPLNIGVEWLDKLCLLNYSEFWDIIKKFNNVRGVLFGHAHCDYESTIEGLPVWCTPSPWVQFALGNGGPKYDNKPGGYRILELLPEGKISTRVERVF